VGIREAVRPPELDDECNRALHRLYEVWAADAEQVLERSRRLAVSGRPVANAEDLEDAYGRVRGRLGLTPEMISRAMDQGG
jgi:hypothetical protein